MRGFCPRAPQPPTMDEPDDTHDNARFEGQTDKRVGPSAVMFEGSDRAFDQPQDIEIRSFGCERHGQGGVGRLTVETGARKAGSGHEVGYRVHGVQHSRRGGELLWIYD